MNYEEDLPVFGPDTLSEACETTKKVFCMIADSALRDRVPKPENIGIVDELQDTHIVAALRQ